MLQLKHVSKQFDKRKILEDINMTFPDVGFIGIQGESGCGKSTLLSIMSSLQQDFEGEVLYNEKNIKDNPEYRKYHVSYMMQDNDFIPALTVYENILMACRVSGVELSKKEYNKIMQELDMTDYESYYPYQLSGGQQQRLSIAKALMKKSSILFCDEPTGALHLSKAQEVMALLKDVSTKMLVIVVSHDQELLKHYCDTVLEMRNGRLEGHCIEKQLISKNLKRRNKFLWFYPIRQMLYQKNKLYFLFVFQWILIVSVFLMITALHGIFESIEQSEQHSVSRNYISIQRKDNGIFENMQEDTMIQDCHYDYHLESLSIKTNEKTYESAIYILPQQTDHIMLSWGQLPQNKNEILVSPSLYNEFKTLQVQLGDDSSLIDVKVVGVLKPLLFQNNECYIHSSLLDEFSQYKDECTLLIESKQQYTRQVYQKYMQDMIAYSETIEKIDNYQSLLSLATLIAWIFIAVCFIVSLILIVIVESIIYFERKHDYAYLMALGLEKKRLLSLTIVESLCIAAGMVFGGSVLSYMAYIYVNDIFMIGDKYMFVLSIPKVLGLKYGFFIVMIFCYGMITILGVIGSYKQMIKNDIVDILR